MQNTPGECEQTPGMPVAPVTPVPANDPGRRYRLRLAFALGKGALFIFLTIFIFQKGEFIIAQNAKRLGFYVLNFDVPLPFLLIGLWSLAVITLTIFSLIEIVKICRLLLQTLRLSPRLQRKVA